MANDMNHWYHPIVDADGNLQAGCQVNIFNQATGAPAMGYDRDGVAIGTTPTFTNGVADIYLPGGVYKFVVTAPGYSETFYNEHVGNAAGSDVGVVNYAGYTYTFEADTSAPPSTAAIRADAVDLTAATELYIDDDTLAGNDISSILLSLAPVTGYATNQIRLTDPSNGAQFVANVTAVSDDTDYVTLTISGGVGATSMTVGSVKMDVTWGGKSGANAGYRLQFSTTTTDGNPGAGKFRADNATYGSITKLWVNEADYDGLDITSWLTSFDDNVNAIGRGNLIIQDQGDTATKFGFNVTGAVVDKTGYREIPVSPMSGAMPANDTIMIANFTPSGADGDDGSDGANGIDGASNFTRVRLVDTSEGSPASDYEAGDTVDGVALAENDLVLRATSAGDPADGVYLVPASGAASRLAAFNSYDSMPGTGFRVMEGTAKANTVWFCESAQGGTLDTTDIVFAEFSAGVASGLTEELQQYIAANEIRWAEANAEQQFTGVTRFADDFSDLTYVDTAGATNLDTSESGVLKPTGESNGNDSYTKVMLHFDGADASTTITDDNASALSHTWTAYGNAQLDTGIAPPFGSSSLLLDGGGDYISMPATSHISASTGDFTIDCWFNVQGGSGATRYLFGQSNSGGTGSTISCQAYLSSGNVLVFLGAQNSFTITGTTTFTSAGWHMLRIARASGVCRMFVDGVQEGGDVTATGAVNNTGYQFSIGRLGELNASYWNGLVAEFRYDVGIARSTTNFTAPTTPYATGISADNLTVAAQSIPCSTAPDTMMSMFIVEPTDSITLNTDLSLSLSRDGGTTKTVSDLSLYSTLADGTLLYASELTDVSGQPSGTDPLWELTSANSKYFKVHAAFLYFGD